MKDDPSLPEELPPFPSSFLLKIHGFCSKLKGFWEAKPNHRVLFVHKIPFSFLKGSQDCQTRGASAAAAPSLGDLVALVAPCFSYPCTSPPGAQQGWRQHLPVIAPLNHCSRLQEQHTLLKLQFKKTPQNTIFTPFLYGNHSALTQCLPFEW